jgi:hypothetical protein
MALNGCATVTMEVMLEVCQATVRPFFREKIHTSPTGARVYFVF